MKTKALTFGLIAGFLSQATPAKAETYNFIFDNAPKSTAAEPAAESNFDRAHRVDAEAGAFVGTRDTGNEKSGMAAGMQVGAGVALSETLRLGAFFGQALARGSDERSASFFGGEGRVLPLHVPMGHSTRMLDLGLVAGFSTFHKVQGNPGSIFVGPMVSARVTKACSIVGAVRANLGSVSADAGVSIRL
ncbi:MAG: hypothetical protein HY075_09465 [Deltaproteobacteria bacterium]|nr:hypothetical protein [Deltaproteobacteria bacterium]